MGKCLPKLLLFPINFFTVDIHAHFFKLRRIRIYHPQPRATGDIHVFGGHIRIKYYLTRIYGIDRLGI